MNKNRDINNDHNNDYNNRKGFLTSSCNNKKTSLIFDNETKQLRFKNSARNINAFPFLLQSLYTIIIIIIRIYFINSIY